MLAAGISERLGRPKQLLELDGKPLLQHAVDRAALHFAEVVVVLGHEAGAVGAALELPPGARIVRNESFRDGQHSSVRAGFAAASRDADAVAMLLGDQPHVGDGLIEVTLEAFARSRAGVVRPRHGDAPGHPVLVRAEVARRLAAAGDEELGRTLRGPEVEWVDGGPEPPADVDTWEDYQALRARS